MIIRKKLSRDVVLSHCDVCVYEEGGGGGGGGGREGVICVCVNGEACVGVFEEGGVVHVWRGEWIYA